MHEHQKIIEEVPHYLLFAGPRLRQSAAFFWEVAANIKSLKRILAGGKAGSKICDWADRLSVAFEPNFELAAIQLLARLKPHPFYNYQPFVVDLACEEGVEITLMALAGLFEKFGSRYDFAIPNLLTLDVVKAACLQLASTEHDKYWLHPEYVVESVSPEMAENWEATQMYTERIHTISDETTWH